MVATKDEHGFLIHEVESFLPNELKPNQLYPAVYVLPVEAKNESRYGDGLLEAQSRDALTISNLKC